MTAGDRRKRPGRIFMCALLFSAWVADAAILHEGRGRPGRQVTAFPSLEQMEKDLLLVLNSERAAQNLPALKPSLPLAALGRRHSSEMSRLDILMHTSATGKSYTDRLVDAGILFAANGENVARSGTFVADLIHQSFMASPGHRENVLNRDFDEIGIGVVRGKGGSYFVTEDFIRGLVRREEKEVRGIVLSAMNESRRKKDLPPFALLGMLNETAQSYALMQAAGRELPATPAFFGEALMRFAAGADLGEITAALTSADLRRYGRAGIGVGFSRNQEYPGGAYFVCAFLVANDPSERSDDLDRLLMILKAANDVRARMNLRPLEFDQGLSRQADLLISRLRNERTASPSVQVSGRAFFFMAQKLDRIDDALRKGLKEAGLRRIGISTLPIRLKDDTSLPFRLKDGTSLQYAVAVILGR